jgi:hypothetical protein
MTTGVERSVHVATLLAWTTGVLAIVTEWIRQYASSYLSGMDNVRLAT